MYENTKKVIELVELRLKVLDENQQFIDHEKEELAKVKKSYEQKLIEMEKQLKTLKGVEYSLYYELVVNGLSVNKAIQRVSLKYDLSESTLWKTYYPNLKEKLEKIKKQE